MPLYVHWKKHCEDDKFIHISKNFKNNKEEINLGVTIDSKLIFDSHIKRMCKEAGQKLSVLSRISDFIDLNKRQVLF